MLPGHRDNKSRKKLAAVLLLITSFFVVELLVTPAYAAVTITTTTSSNSTGYPSQRKIFNATGLWWEVGASDGANLFCSTSSDKGSTWSSKSLFTTAGGSTAGYYWSSALTGTTLESAATSTSSVNNFYYYQGTMSKSGGCNSLTDYNAIDNSVTSVVSSGSSITATLTTYKTNDLVLIWVGTENNGAAVTVSSVTATGLTPTKRGGVSYFYCCTSYNNDFEEWYAVSASTLSSVVFTATLSASASTYVSMTVIAIQGSNTASPFDSHAGLPVQTSVSNTNVESTLSTSNANDLIIGGIFTSNPLGTNAAGFSTASSFENANSVWEAMQYDSVSSTQTGLTFGYTATGSSSTVTAGLIGDAIQMSTLPTQTIVTTTNNVVAATEQIAIDGSGNTFVEVTTNDGTNNHVEVWKCAATCTTTSNWSKVKDISPVSDAALMDAAGSDVAVVFNNSTNTYHDPSVAYSTNAGVAWGHVTSLYDSGIQATFPNVLPYGSAVLVGSRLFIAIDTSSGGATMESTILGSGVFAYNAAAGAGPPVATIGAGSTTEVSVAWSPSTKTIYLFVAYGSSIYYSTNDSTYPKTWHIDLVVFLTSTTEPQIQNPSLSTSYNTNTPGALWSSGASSPYNVRIGLLYGLPAQPNSYKGTLLLSETNLLPTEQAKGTIQLAESNLLPSTQDKGTLQLTETNPIPTSQDKGTLSLCLKINVSSSVQGETCYVSATLTFTAAAGSNAIGSTDYFSVSYTYLGVTKTLNAANGANSISADQGTTISVTSESSLSGPTAGKWCVTTDCSTVTTAAIGSGTSYSKTFTYTFTPPVSTGGCSTCVSTQTNTFQTGTNVQTSQGQTLNLNFTTSDPNGYPIQGVTFTLTGSNGNAMCITGNLGTCSIVGIYPGNYTLAASFGNLPPTVANLQVSQPGTYQLAGYTGNSPTLTFVPAGGNGQIPPSLFLFALAGVFAMLAIIGIIASRRKIQKTGDAVADEFRTKPKPTSVSLRRNPGTRQVNTHKDPGTRRKKD